MTTANNAVIQKVIGTISVELAPGRTYEELCAAIAAFDVNSQGYSLDKVQMTGTQQLTKSVWIYQQWCDDEPAVMTPDGFDSSGIDIGEDLLVRMQEHGVCSEIRYVYPRADRYGIPEEVGSMEAVLRLIAEQGFKVACTDGQDDVFVDMEDRGDDGTAEYWLKIQLPADFDTQQ